jgi:hypothetical protein
MADDATTNAGQKRKASMTTATAAPVHVAPTATADVVLSVVHDAITRPM